MTIAPDPRVQARLHGGPHHGETLHIPWARIEIPVLSWDASDEPVISLYRLSMPWRGQNTAEYRYVQPDAEHATEMAGGGRSLLTLLKTRARALTSWRKRTNA